MKRGHGQTNVFTHYAFYLVSVQLTAATARDAAQYWLLMVICDRI